ncbi:hypothetical protein FRC02_005233 [Tulasnella sp. 418]|nr:hypothetical protein FRC02_005233 [Tulasnella sp. 418]
MLIRASSLLFALSFNVAVGWGAAPTVDFTRMGSVAVAGAFSGLDLFDTPASFPIDPTTATILARAPNGTMTPVGFTSNGGKISAACYLDGKLYIGGLFSSVNSVSALNIASYDPSSRTFAPLGSDGNGLDNQVLSLHCDADTRTLWVGGAFKSPVAVGDEKAAYGGSVACYQPATGKWSPPPFTGLSGAGARVLAITPSSSRSALLFSGSFITSFQSNSSIQAISNPSVPQSSGATSFSSSLVPVPLTNAEIVAEPSTRANGFSDIKAILCPTGGDGPGQTWRSADGSRSVITVRTFRFITARGFRLGNTFLDGRGAKSFFITAIPDNDVVSLTYIDPATKQNVTCSDPCPILHDPAIPYQDFLLTTPRVITGFQVTINEWFGAGSGLHLLQLLSDGAFATAINGDNSPSCYAPGGSGVATDGNWRRVNAFTDIAGTTQDILTIDVSTSTSSATGPSLTWHPYISASGIYDVYFLIPGCRNLQDCGRRTSVKVTVFPGGGLPPQVTTISERVTDDTMQLIYNGPVYPNTPDFTSTVTLSLADNPEGPGQDGLYTLVADRVQFRLITANNGDVAFGNGTMSSVSTPGFGFFEWPLNSQGSVNATGILSNTTRTALDDLAQDVYAAIGGTTVNASPVSINVAFPQSSDSIIFAGSFNLSSHGLSNFAAYVAGNITRVGGNGLNGPVYAMIPSEDRQTLYVGGAFTDTADSNNNRFRGIAQYNVMTSSWSPVGGGVDGVVSSLSLVDGRLNVAGNFTHVLSTNAAAGGFASFDTKSQAWLNPGTYLIGSLSLAVDSDNGGGQEYIAGNLAVFRRYGADGFAMLENSKEGPVVVRTPAGQLSTVQSARAQRRHLGASPHHQSHDNLSQKWQKRQTSSSGSLPVLPSAPAPAVLAGAFWTNSTSGSEVAIIGGNFSVQSSGVGLAVYDVKSRLYKPLVGSQVDGTVLALYVSGDTLFVGGDFAIPGGDGRSLAMYDLSQQVWKTGVLQGLEGSRPIVRSLTSAPSISDTLIVAGSFAVAGSSPCEAICAWNNAEKRWRSLGAGLRGEVASVDFAGPDYDLLVVGGALTLADGTSANVAQFSFSNSTWIPLGSTTGPVTAVVVNSLNSSSIFAAGRTGDNTKSYISHWNGFTWTTIDGGQWDGVTHVSQLRVVPLQDQHPGTDIIQSDRGLMMTGSLLSNSQGAMGSALYDGQAYHPYILTSASDGSSGFVSMLFNSISTFSFSRRRFLATGIVILISIAIATGIIFLLLLIGILWTICSRREGGLANPNPDDDSDNDSFNRHRPSSLLEHINAATRTTILGGATNDVAQGGARNARNMEESGPDGSGWARTETPNDLLGGTAGTAIDGAEDVYRPTRARYSFDGTGDGELSIGAGAEVVVLDDRDPAWWYARDVATGNEGIVPASYLY